MSYITIINDETITCAKKGSILTEEEVSQFDEIDHVTKQLKELKESESERISKSEQIGYREGYEAGLERGLSDLNLKFKEHLKNLVENVYISSSEIDKIALDLAFEVVRKIVDNIENNDMIVGIASNAIRKLKQHDRLEIRVNPEYVETLEQSLIAISETNPENPHFEIVGDYKLNCLDCIIKTDTGVTIASFDEQLKVLRDRLVKDMSKTAELPS